MPVMSNHGYPVVTASLGWWRDIGIHLLEIGFPKPTQVLGESSETLFTCTLCLPAPGHFIRHAVELGWPGWRLRACKTPRACTRASYAPLAKRSATRPIRRKGVDSQRDTRMPRRVAQSSAVPITDHTARWTRLTWAASSDSGWGIITPHLRYWTKTRNDLFLQGGREKRVTPVSPFIMRRTGSNAERSRMAVRHCGFGWAMTRPRRSTIAAWPFLPNIMALATRQNSQSAKRQGHSARRREAGARRASVPQRGQGVLPRFAGTQFLEERLWHTLNLEIDVRRDEVFHLALGIDNTHMFEVQTTEERRHTPYWLLCGHIRHGHLKGGFHVCSIACQRRHQITRDLEVLLALFAALAPRHYGSTGSR